MLTPDECRATARELETMAQQAPALADSLLKMAQEWERLAQAAAANEDVRQAAA